MGTKTSTRGRLEVFLGCAPGVGKTYEMLAEARGMVEEGIDVVAAVVETHGRAVTASMADGFEVIDCRRTTYRGTALSELDIDAVLARRPAVALVDEMAHTNAPGSRNSKRWQDIEELLDAGIDVLTTVNIQHLESLNDVVAQITGVVQRETVPDSVVRSAEQIELVDIAPQALRQRLSAGKVYPSGRIDGALANYFRQGNLTALRELALLWLADQVDDNLADYRAVHAITDTWEARERVVVAVTGGPESATLIRRGSRIASRSSAELVVVHILRGDGLLSAADVGLSHLTELAAGVGAQVHTVVGDDTPTALLDFARGVNATQLVLGTSRRPRWKRIFDEGVGAAVIHDSGRIDVHMVTHEETTGRNPLDIRRRRLARPLSWLCALIVPAATTGVLAVVDHWLGFASASAVYLVAVLTVSLLGGVGPAVVSGVISGLLLNFFFTDPRHTFEVSQADNLITIIVMLIVAVAVAVLVNSAAVGKAAAQQATRDAELLTAFSDAVLGGATAGEMLERLRETFDQDGLAVLQRVEDGPDVEPTGGQPDPTGLTVAEPAPQATALGEAGPGSRVVAIAGTAPTGSVDAATTVCPVGAGEFTLLMTGPPPSARDRRVLNSVATQIAGVIQRKQLEAQAATARALAETDELRRALLAAVSHDLRTPLASAKIAASSLLSSDVVFSPEDTTELLATVDESLDQLTTLVGNLLDSSRLAAGAISPVMQRTYLIEVVHRATAVTLGKNVTSQVSFEFNQAWAYTDAGLLERVLANLIDNALRHGGGDITVSTDLDHDAADGQPRSVIRVIDHGLGIPPQRRAEIFDAFWHEGASRYGAQSGVGLGLSVALGFTTALSGTLTVGETPGGGTTMMVALPATSPAASGELSGTHAIGSVDD